MEKEKEKEKQNGRHHAKTLICALNLLSRDLPLPPHILNSVSSIYRNHVTSSLFFFSLFSLLSFIANLVLGFAVCFLLRALLFCLYVCMRLEFRALSSYLATRLLSVQNVDFLFGSVVLVFNSILCYGLPSRALLLSFASRLFV